MNNVSFLEKYTKIIQRIKENIDFLKEIEISSESDLIMVLSSILGCDFEVRKKFLSFEFGIDIFCPESNIAIEVEFNKTPYEGIHQVIAYAALLGYNSILLHVVEFSFEDYLTAIRRLFKYINKENIKGIIVNLKSGDVVGIQ